MNDFVSSWLGLETGHNALQIGNNLVAIRWGLTLLHFLWQGAIVGLISFLAEKLLRNHSASVRYWLNAVALLVCPICVAWTFTTVDVPESWRVSSNQQSHASLGAGAVPIDTSNADNLVDVPYPKLDPLQVVSSTDAAPVPLDASPENPATTPVAIEIKTSTTSEWMPVVTRCIAILYAVGVVCFLVRLAIALWGGHRLRAISKPVSDSALLELIRTQAHRIGLKLVPVVASCERVAVPTVIGVLRPMILLPATLTTALSTDELSAILSHELAHIRRYDLWMNLLQRIIESLLFFHPVVWFLSRRLSAEREICCDDLVIRCGHQPMNYAGALLRMAELCVLARNPQLVSLSAAGRSSAELEHRIVRLMQKQRKSTLRLNRIGIMVLLAILIASSATPAMFSGWSQQDDGQHKSEATLQEFTVPEKISQQLSSDESAKFLATLRERDREFENRTLKVELHWDELMSPQGEAAEASFHMKKLGAQDAQIPQGLPDNYQQPHRVQYSWTRRGDEAIVERFADQEKAVLEKFSRMEKHRLDHTDSWKYLLPCGVGFSDQIDSVTSTEVVDRGYVIKGLLKRSSAVIDGRENSFVIHVDEDLIIRRFELKYHVYDFVVVTWGTHQSPDAPATAEHGDFTKYYCVTKGDRLGERSGIAEHYAYQVIDVSDRLTDEEFNRRVLNNPLKNTEQNGVPALKLPESPNVSVSVKKAGDTSPIVDATNSPEVEIRYPHCIVSTENLSKRSLPEAISVFNLASQESPTGVLDLPVTEKETRDAITKFAAERHVPEALRAQLDEILKSGTLPSNVYFRRFTRFDDGKQMQGVWWVRLVVETNGPVYSVPVRSRSLYSRPYTQMERQQNADGLTLINRVASYYEEPPVVVQPPDLPAASIETLIRKTQDAIKAEDDTAIGTLFESTGASETQREFAVSELKALSKARVHSIKVSPLKLKGELRTWSAWQYFKPNLPIVGFLEIEYEDNEVSTRRADAQPLAKDRKVLSLELGLVGDELRLVSYVPDGERTPPEALNPGPSITGHLEPLANGTHLVTDIITNPGSLLSAHLANEEIRQRDFRNASEQEE